MSAKKLQLYQLPITEVGQTVDSLVIAAFDGLSHMNIILGVALWSKIIKNGVFFTSLHLSFSHLNNWAKK